jgi:hypothetical protein
VRQTGRLLRCFHEGDCLIDFCHVAIMREPRTNGGIWLKLRSDSS